MFVPRWKSLAVAALVFGLGTPAALFAAEPTPARQKSGSSKKEKEKSEKLDKPAASPANVDAPATAPKLPPETAPTTPEAKPLTSEEMADAATLDTFTVPTPGELFAALNKQCKPNWTAQARGPINTAYKDRAQAALNLGGLIADGYIAVEAQDAQQVKNIGRDILALSKTLGVGKEILARGASITAFADDNNWPSLREELESTQNEVKQEMESLHDEELVTLLSIGGWIRGTQVVSNVVLKNFSQETSCILRQPALVEFLRGKLDKLPTRTKDSALIKAVDAGLEGMGKTVSFPLGATPTKDEVQTLYDQAVKLGETISAKQPTQQ